MAKTTENAKLIKFLLLTGLRISEAQNGYVDSNRFRVDDRKNDKSHWAYLTKLAVAVYNANMTMPQYH